MPWKSFQEACAYATTKIYNIQKPRAPPEIWTEENTVKLGQAMLCKRQKKNDWEEALTPRIRTTPIPVIELKLA